MAINRSESVKRLNLNDFKGWSEVKRSNRAEAKRLIGELLVDRINSFLDRSTSPVEGGSFQRKKADGKSNSRLFEDGDMRSQIVWSESGSQVAVGIFRTAPTVERLKSVVHNTGEGDMPERRFIPNPGGSFKPVINNAIQRIINGFSDGEA